MPATRRSMKNAITVTAVMAFSLVLAAPAMAAESAESPSAQLKLARWPSIGTLHNSLARVEVPSTGITVRARCRLARDTGRVGSCQFEAPPTDALRSAVNQRMDEMAFDTSTFPAGQGPLVTTLEIRIEARERQELGAPTSALPADDIEWSKVFIAHSARRPSESTENKSGPPDTAIANVDCVVQADASLACLKVDITLGEGVVVEPYNYGRFTLEAHLDLSERRAAAATGSGVPTRGRWVHFALPLTLPHDSLDLARERIRKLVDGLGQKK
jgi:hypothetical protein